MKFHYIFCSLSIYFFKEVYSEDESEVCSAEQKEPWSYRGENGPPYWGLNYTTCYGSQQSPIAFSSSDAKEDNSLEKLVLNNYDQPISKGTILNNGHTIQVVPDDGISRTISINGLEYSLQQFHFHWGDTWDKGSEHTLDKIQYAMELHLVHMSEDNKIAVVGIFLQQQDDDNKELQKLVDQLQNVTHKGDKVALEPGILLDNLVPANPTSYYRYQGSLTTPPCSEGVTWSVAPDTIPVGRAQMEVFRQKLYSVEKGNEDESCKLVNNFRPLQPLTDRTVYRSQ